MCLELAIETCQIWRKDPRVDRVHFPPPASGHAGWGFKPTPKTNRQISQMTLIQFAWMRHFNSALTNISYKYLHSSLWKGHDLLRIQRLLRPLNLLMDSHNLDPRTISSRTVLWKPRLFLWCPWRKYSICHLAPHFALLCISSNVCAKRYWNNDITVTIYVPLLSVLHRNVRTEFYIYKFELDNTT